MNKVLKAWWFGQLACALAAESLAQGQIFIGNRILLDGIDAPVFDSDCVTRLAGTDYLLQAYIGFTPDSLKPLGPVVSFRTGQYAGYIATYALDVPGTSTTLVYAQLRACRDSLKMSSFGLDENVRFRRRWSRPRWAGWRR